MPIVGCAILRTRLILPTGAFRSSCSIFHKKMKRKGLRHRTGKNLKTLTRSLLLATRAPKHRYTNMIPAEARLSAA